MRFTRGTLIATLALAVTATAGCSARDDPANASPGASSPATTAKPDTGFGGSPQTSAPTPTAPAATAAPAAEREPEPDRTTPSTKPAKTKAPTVKDWAAVVKPCPYEGQKPVIQDVVHEDVTKDGGMDTIVTRSCEASTSYWASTIEVFENTTAPRGAKRAGTLLEDVAKMDQPVVEQVLFNRGVIGVKAYGTSDKGTRACPDLILFYRYEYTGGKFKRIWRDAGFKQECVGQ